MQKVTFINARGDSIELYQSPFFLNKIEGLGGVDADIKSQKILGQDGSFYINATLEERAIPIEVVILKNLQANRQLISKIFNPKLGQGVLIYENDTVKRMINAIPEHAPKFSDERPRKVERVIIDLLCHDPYFYEEKIDKTDIALWESNLIFPLEIPEAGMEVGFRSPSLIVNVLNDGHVDTGMIIRFKAVGTVVNPSLVNVNTGEFFKLNRTLVPGEIVTVNTNSGNKRIESESNGVVSNIFNNIVFGSTFLQLSIGDNLFRYDADTYVDALEVTIYSAPKYVGV